MKRLRTILLNLLLIIISLSLFDLMFEWIFVSLYLFDLPLQYHYILPRPYRSLALHNKHKLMPKDGYILLLGDSYAQGLGDWFFRAAAGKSGPFGSADVIFQRSGRDILNLGKSGFSTVSALSLAPRSTYAYINSSYFLRLTKPRYVVYYFYEGNDLTDNLRVLPELGIDADVSSRQLADRRFYQNMIADKMNLQNSYYVKGTYLYFLPQYISLNIINALVQSLLKGEQAPPEFDFPDGSINSVQVGGKVVTIPDELQGPALELTREELDRSLAIVDSAFSDLKEQFPEAEILIIYLPSPLTSYEIAGENVSAQSYFHRGTTYPLFFLKERGRLVENSIRLLAKKHNFVFLNIRNALRRADTIVHGPNDWKHFNEKGYTILGENVAQLMKNTKP